jgi:WD40 repeat protein
VASLYALPTRVLQRIFSFFNARELAALSLVCKAWRTIIDDDYVWNRSFLNNWAPPDTQIINRTWKERYKVEINWTKGRYWSYSLQGHSASITALHFADRHLVSGSIDTKVNLWDLKSRKVIRVMPGHTGGVRCVALALSQDAIYSGSDDRTVKMWSFESGKLLKTLRDHAGEVTCMQAEPERNLLVTGSNDASIKLWDTRVWKATQVFKSRDKVLCLQKHNDIMVTAGQDKIIRLWDVRQNSALSELKGHTEAIRAVQFDENQIVSGSDDGTVR